jgi:hypothetical protein
MQAELCTGRYRLCECRLVHGRNRTAQLWSTLDALALK